MAPRARSRRSISARASPRTLADEIDDLATESAIDQELAALKQRMAKDEERSESR